MTCVTGPWTQPEPPRLPAADRAAAIRDSLKLRRIITRLAEARELGRLAKRRLERMEPALRQAGNLIGLRTARGYIAELSDDLERIDEDIEASAEHLLLALNELQDELSIHEAGAVLGVHHCHIERQGGALLKAAVKAPVSEPVADALLDAVIRRMMADKIMHRKARSILNRTLGTELPLPPRPRPTAV